MASRREDHLVISELVYEEQLQNSIALDSIVRALYRSHWWLAFPELYRPRNRYLFSFVTFFYPFLPRMSLGIVWFFFSDLGWMIVDSSGTAENMTDASI
jgi:hypothetical protein